MHGAQRPIHGVSGPFRTHFKAQGVPLWFLYTGVQHEWFWPPSVLGRFPVKNGGCFREPLGHIWYITIYTSNSPIGGWGMAVTAIIWLINEWVSVFPRSRGDCSLPLYSEGRASLTPPCATRWLSVLYISPATSENKRFLFHEYPTRRGWDLAV